MNSMGQEIQSVQGGSKGPPIISKVVSAKMKRQIRKSPEKIRKDRASSKKRKIKLEGFTIPKIVPADPSGKESNEDS